MKKLILSAALLLAACSESGPDPIYPGLDFISFDYAAFGGRPGGSFLAAGEVGAAFPVGDWAAAFRTGAASGPVTVAGSRPAGNGNYDVIAIHLPAGVRAGDRLGIMLMCEAAQSCAQVEIGLGVDAADLTPEVGCALRDGQVRITGRTERRLLGTFSGTSECGGAATGDTQITAGSFDVPLRDRP
jgi:hypothetical protein